MQLLANLYWPYGQLSLQFEHKLVLQIPSHPLVICWPCGQDLHSSQLSLLVAPTILLTLLNVPTRQSKQDPLSVFEQPLLYWPIEQTWHGRHMPELVPEQPCK